MSIEEIEKLNIGSNPSYDRGDLDKLRTTFVLAEDAKNQAEDEEELEEAEKEQLLLQNFESSMELKYTKIDLKKLQLLLKKGVLTQSNIDSIIQEEMLKRSDIEDIFRQIDRITKIQGRKKSLPDELMMKKGDYLEALTDLKARLASIEKLKEALIFLREAHRHDQGFLYLIYNIYTIFERNLRLIQEEFVRNEPSLQKTVNGFQKEHRNKFWNKIMGFFK